MKVDKMLQLFAEIEFPIDGFKKLPDHEKLSKREDLHIFLLLNQIFERAGLSETHDLIQAAEHDIVYFYGDLEEIAKVITEREIYILAISGLNVDGDGIYMNV